MNANVITITTTENLVEIVAGLQREGMRFNVVECSTGWEIRITGY